MILDSSALVAILLKEPGWENLKAQIDEAAVVALGAPTLTETALVLTRRGGPEALAVLSGFLREAEVQILPFQLKHHEIAMEAFLRYGKGRHKAALNFGDCLSYAVARVAAMPLLYVGNDFAATDVNELDS